jgi:hypothetical protein
MSLTRQPSADKKCLGFMSGCIRYEVKGPEAKMIRSRRDYRRIQQPDERKALINTSCAHRDPTPCARSQVNTSGGKK